MSQAPLLIDTQWDTRGLRGNCSSNYLFLCVHVCLSVYNPLVSCVVLISEETELISNWEKGNKQVNYRKKVRVFAPPSVSVTPSFNKEWVKIH